MFLNFLWFKNWTDTKILSERVLKTSDICTQQNQKVRFETGRNMQIPGNIQTKRNLDPKIPNNMEFLVFVWDVIFLDLGVPVHAKSK